jgi:clan AA aspartic protease (TIGR02281 family)
MEQRLALWIGAPFIGVAWSLIALVALAPGRVNGRLLMLLLLALSVTGILILVTRITVRDRANNPLPDTLYPIAGILVAIGIGFHQEIGAITRSLHHYVMPGNSASDGMHLGRAGDGQFHIMLTVEGSAVDFTVDVEAPFNVLAPDVPKQIGINPSSLIYNQRIELAAGRTEYAADMVLPRARLGATTIEGLSVKVFATSRWGNVLGKPFFDQLKSWRIDDDTLIIVR